jgi:predicted nuclease of predicted toxin-antitoxin system
MKLLLDQGLPRTTASLLRGTGTDAVHTSEVGLSEAEDEEILSRGLVEERVVVTLDADFHALLALAGANKPSVIRIRIQGLRADEMAELVMRVVQQCEADLQHGAVVSVTEGRVRVRQLPLIP